jgi:hypothetical protein
MKTFIRISCLLMILASCKGHIPEGKKVIDTQPYEDFSPETANPIYTAIRNGQFECSSNSVLLKELMMPKK